MSTMELAPPRRGRCKTPPAPPPTFRDLSLVSRSGDVATFGATSKSRPGHINLVHIDITNGDVFCECRWCETRPAYVDAEMARQEERRCWLSREVPKAWRATIGREVA